MERNPSLILLAIGVAAFAESITAQPSIWQHAIHRLTVNGGRWYVEKQVHRATPSQSQRQAIFNLLKSRKDVQSCLPEDSTFLEKLRYSSVPLSPKAKVILVEAGPGCARGAQGSNGAMWLVRFEGLKPTLLASPQEGFEG